MCRVWLLLLVATCGFSAPNMGTDAAMPDDAPVVITDASDDATQDWWHPAWRSRRLITIDNTKLAGNVTGFPVLIKLTPATINYAAVAPNGADLRFVTANHTTELAHELDSYIANGDTFVWVRMPSMMPSGANPTLWLYYDNPTAPGTSDGAAVFADTHVSVHHLGPNGYPDATGRGHEGTAANNATPGDTTGIVAGARSFDGNNDVITLLDETAYDFSTALSASAWVRVAVLNIAFQTIVAKGNTSWRLHRHNEENVPSFGTTSVMLNTDADGSTALESGAWLHVAIVYATPTKQLFVDGVLEASAPVAVVDTNNLPVTIGANLESVIGGGRHWNGAIDEVRVSETARPPAWIAAEHTTVRDPAFVSIGAEQRY